MVYDCLYFRFEKYISNKLALSHYIIVMFLLLPVDIDEKEITKLFCLEKITSLVYHLC